MEELNKFFPEFTSKYLLNNNNLPIITFKENTVRNSSNPFSSVLLSYYLKNNINVIFIAERESLIHYSTILRKFSINLLSNKNLIYVGIITIYNSLLSSELPLSENVPKNYDILRTKYYISSGDILDKNKYTLNYSKLFQEIEEKRQRLENPKNKTVIIIDKISTFNYDIALLLEYSIKNKMGTVLTVNLDTNCQEIIDYIIRMSDIVFDFKQNESGFSKDIDGIVEINCNMDSINDDVSEENNKNKLLIRYALKENGINFFTHYIF